MFDTIHLNWDINVGTILVFLFGSGVFGIAVKVLIKFLKKHIEIREKKEGLKAKREEEKEVRMERLFIQLETTTYVLLICDGNASPEQKKKIYDQHQKMLTDRYEEQRHIRKQVMEEAELND